MREPARSTKISVQRLTMAYGSFTVMEDLSFDVMEKDIFIIMGGSGCGKSTLMRHMVGLKEPAAGEIHFDGENFTSADEAKRLSFVRRFGVMYQSGALWSSMTLAENIAMPLEEHTGRWRLIPMSCSLTNPVPDWIRSVRGGSMS